MFGLRTKIWERYFATQFLKSILFLLFGFFALYVFIDYSAHASTFHHNLSFGWKELLFYYLSEFSSRFNMLIPFAVLIAAIKTLCTLNNHNELVALMASGTSVKVLLRPFVIIALGFTTLTFLNTQFLEPVAATHLKRFSEEKRSLKKSKNAQPMVENLALADNSTLLFRSYDSTKERFFDSYWIRSADDIYRIKHLYPYEEVPVGESVNHLVRDDSGAIVEVETLKRTTFPEMHFNKKRLIETTTQPDELSLTALWEKTPFCRSCKSEKESAFLTTFYLKSTLPWLCLIAVLAPAPYCIAFSRNKPVFLIYATATFAMIALFLIIEAAEVMAKRQVIHPFFAITLPVIIMFALVAWKYRRL